MWSISNPNLAGARKWNYSCLTAISIFFIEFFLHTTLISYGVFYYVFVEEEIYSEKEALWVPVVVLSVWKMSQPFFKRICETFEDDPAYQKILMTSSIFIMFLSFASSSLISDTFFHVVSYGFVGGITMGIVENIINISTYEEFQSKPRILEGIRQLSRAIGLFVMPHIILQISRALDIFGTQLAYSAFLLNIIPAGLVLTRTKKSQLSTRGNLHKFKTLSGLLETMSQKSIELSPIKCPEIEESREFSFLDEEYNVFTPPQIEDFQEVDFDEPETSPNKITTVAGVEILPQIQEESETEEELERNETQEAFEENNSEEHLNDNEIKEFQEKELMKNSMRHGRLSGNLYEALAKEEGIEIIRSTDVLLSIEDIPSIFNEKPLKSRGKSRNRYLSPYKRYILQKKVRNCKEFFQEVFEPLKNCFLEINFIPAIILKSTVQLMTLFFIVIVPQLAIAYGNDGRVPINSLEATFLLSLISFSWSFFLISLVWIIDVSKSRLRAIHVLGLCVEALSSYVSGKFFTHDIITVNCLLFGLGYGMITYTEDIILRESIGVRKWKDVEGPLNLISGILILAIYTVISVSRIALVDIFNAFCIVYLVNAIIWTLLPICRFFWFYVIRIREMDSALME